MPDIYLSLGTLVVEKNTFELGVISNLSVLNNRPWYRFQPHGSHRSHRWLNPNAIRPLNEEDQVFKVQIDFIAEDVTYRRKYIYMASSSESEAEAVTEKLLNDNAVANDAYLLNDEIYIICAQELSCPTLNRGTANLKM